MSLHLLPVKHFHIIFTLPHQLNDLIFYNQKRLYSLLFRAAWQTIQQVMQGGKTGMVATLHSWGSNLSYHPHLHCIVAAGSFKDEKWQPSCPLNPRFFCDASLLRETFKELFLKKLLQVIELEELRWWEDAIENDETFPRIRSMYRKIKRKKWTVRIENPVLGVRQIIEYLARYVRRVAITNSRIEAVSVEKVTINYKQYALQKPGKPPPVGKMEMEGTTFLQRFCQHFMPRRFHKVRYFGCYAFGAKRLKARIHQHLTGQPPAPYQPPKKKEIIKKMLGQDPDVCINCGMMNAFVTEKITTDTEQLFRLTPAHRIPFIRAGPGKVKHTKAVEF